ncbi:putative malate permease [Scheffersomyces stipitis CBS 6054]|uniref:Putative malate permease n=1 Tax=Scheffersomyces stipitis (strain ATCC 58785 / CBS 6054 / NBRC 10063 / NRRL Y-11545) TaxID=322104 RepID=A3LS27_PICST|nr:putative malate permease [Scheffersomyces stipitis CBS 6054]ABN65836.2 putative malate permease [Scheffersomyces stipitis CBS 6054]
MSELQHKDLESQSFPSSNKDVADLEENENIDNEVNVEDGDSSTPSGTPIKYGQTTVQKPFLTRLRELLFRELIEKFVPAYFATILGLGITAVMCSLFPYPANWLQIIGKIVFGTNVLVFLVLTFSCLIGFYYYPSRIVEYHVHPLHSVFMSTYVMGYIVIVNFIRLLVGSHHSMLLWVLWWIAVFMSVYCSLVIYFFGTFSKLNKPTKLEHMHSVSLLPVVTLAVASSSGHLISMSLPSLNHFVITEVCSFLLWGICVGMGVSFMPIYLARIMIHRIPNTALILTNLLPIGLLGQTSYSLFLFGVNMYERIPDKVLGTSFLVSCALFATVVCAFGYYMTFVGILSVLSKIRPFTKKPNPQFTHPKYGHIMWNKGFWAVNFPLGTMSLASTEIGKGVVGNYPLKFFTVVACMYSVTLFLFTIYNVMGVLAYWYDLAVELFNPETEELKTA